LASSYAALILADEGIEITVRASPVSTAFPRSPSLGIFSRREKRLGEDMLSVGSLLQSGCAKREMKISWLT
ncbi:hypothetical protein, partial [Klebsiella pneumoniae]